MAVYGQRFTCEESYKDQKNKPVQKFHMNCLKLGTEDRWDRMWLIFALAYYWLNVGGWVVEHGGEDREWRANRSEQCTHALWRLGDWAIGLLGYWAIGLLGYWAIGLLGYWVLQRHDLVWQALVRNQAAFRGAVRR